jgi:hypothetical protein
MKRRRERGQGLGSVAEERQGFPLPAPSRESSRASPRNDVVNRFGISFCAAAAALALLAACPDARANPFGYHEHDGFYLRLSAGLGTLHVARSTDQASVTDGIAFTGSSSTVGGASIFTELSVGGTPFKHIVIAGTLLGDNLPAAEVEVASGSRFDLGSALTFAMLAPTVDVFPNTSGGFHAGGGVGWAIATASISDPIFDTIGGGGLGATLHVGYDFWVGDDWSFGAMARGVVARIQGEQQSTAGTTGHEHDTVTTLSIALSFLYH